MPKKSKPKIVQGHPLSAAVEHAFGVMSVFGFIEAVPPLPRPENSPEQLVQWDRMNPDTSTWIADWSDFKDTPTVRFPQSSGVALAKEITANTMRAARGVMEGIWKSFPSSATPNGIPDKAAWQLRTMAAAGTLWSYLAPNWLGGNEIDKYWISACMVARDRLKLDHFASAVHDLYRCNAERVVVTEGKPVAELPTFNVLTPKERAILSFLANASTVQTQTMLEQSVTVNGNNNYLSRRTIGSVLAGLREKGLVARPKGIRKGEAITSAGRALIAH